MFGQILRTARRVAAVTVAAVAVLGAAACGDDSSTGPSAPRDAYVLRGVNGASIPALIFEGQIDLGDGVPVNAKLTILSAYLRLHDDGTYSSQAKFKIKIAGETDTDTDTETGTWSTEGDNIFFTPDDSELEPFQGTMNGKTITVTADPGQTGTTITMRFSK